MKSWHVWLSVAGMSLAGACRFDREPFFRKTNAGISPSDPTVSPAEPVDAAGGILVRDGAAELNSASQPVEAGAALEAGDALDPAGLLDSSTPNDPLPPPMTGGLQCRGEFCPFAVDPAKPCCTTQTDFDRRTTRAAARCGLDLSPLGSAAFGEGCWQRDQLGIVDERCPNVEVEIGMPPEPGCCTDDGQCGSMNSSQKLGCRHPPGSAARACDDTPSTATCDPTGDYAVRITTDAVWGGRSGGLVGLTNDGRGEIQVYLAMSIDGVDPATHELNVRGRVCGVRFPAFYSTTLCESYQPIFPDTIWEARRVPKFDLRGRYECSASGCLLSLEPDTYLLGFDLANPEAPWPRASETATLACPSGRGARCFPDDDDDGRPGIQVDLQTSGRAPSMGRDCPTGYAYRGAPLSDSVAAIFNGVRRADRTLLGTRMKVGSSVRLSDDCGGGRGSAVTEYVNSRAYGCLVEPGTYDFPNVRLGAGEDEMCQSAETEFLDANLPEYQLLAAGEVPPSGLNLSDRSASRGPLSSLLRLGDATDAISCETIRTASYR